MKELLIAFFIINALFWGLMPHSVHCDITAKFTNAKCPPHIFHITFGLVCFMIAVVLAQNEYFENLYRMFYGFTQTAGRLTESAILFFKKSTSQFTNIEDFASNVESYVDNM